jgi:acyl-CoA synthetase (AMP-forming)/AMP-acid ligase II
VTHDPTQARTVPELIGAMAIAYGDRRAVVKDDEVLSYRGLDERSAALARGLLRRGVGKATRVGILMGNGPEWVVWWAAVSRVGALCIPISTFLRPAELGRVIRHADLQGLIATPRFLGQDYLEHLESEFPEIDSAGGGELALRSAPYLRWVVAVALDPVRPWAHTPAWLAAPIDPWDELRAAAEREVHVEDEAIVIYTSGQSAEPKGVVHTHGSVLTKIHYLREMLEHERSSQVESTMPFFWVGGLVMALLTAMEAGATVSCVDRSSFRQVIGATKQANRYEHLRWAPALGMTETFGMYSWGREWRVPGSELAAPLDLLQPGFEVKVVDADGKRVANGERGEILVRGPSLATRLHKVERHECFDADGFYRTGDEGRVDGDRIHFTGRLGDMIKTSGANVSPAEVERELSALDGVVAAHVVGVPDARRGELVAAAVVLDASAHLDAERIRELLNARLSAYKVPRKIVFFDSIDEIPMTATMKVRKPALAELLARTDETANV